MAFNDALTKRLALQLTGDPTGAVKALKDTAREVDATNAKVEKLNKVKVEPPTGGLGKWVDDLRAQGGIAGKTLDQLGISGTNAGAALQAGLLTGAAAGGAALVAFGAKAVSAASALTEQTNKAGVIFGEAAGQVTKFAQNADTGFGLSKRAALEATSSFGNLLKATGQGADGIASMSVKLAGLAGDLASFNNISTGDAVQKLLSGLSGEAEPLRQVGVFLTEGKVKAEAYASGIAKAGAELTEGQKIQARYNIILRETAAAQGDFGRTSDSLANQQRVLAAQFENLEAAIGTLLIPVVTAAISKMNEFLGPIVAVVEKLQDFRQALDLDLPAWVTTPLKIGLEFQVPVVGPAIAALDLFKASYRTTYAGLEAVFGKAPQALEPTERAIQTLVDEFRKGGPWVTDFFERAKANPQLAQSIEEMARKFPELNAAIQSAQLPDFERLAGQVTDAVNKFSDSTVEAANDLLGFGDAFTKVGAAFTDFKTKVDTGIKALEQLPRAQFEAEKAQRGYESALKSFLNVNDEIRLAEIERLEQGKQLEAQQARNAQAEREVEQARRSLVDATLAETEAENAYSAAIEQQRFARDRATLAEQQFEQIQRGLGASSREYAAATDQVARASLAVAQAHLNERNALAAAADAQRALATAKQFAVQQYQLELAAASVSAQQAQASYQQLVVSLAALALASGQAAAAQALLNDKLLDGQAAAQANAQAQLLAAQASLTAIQNANALANAQQAVTDAQAAYAQAQQRVQDATRSLNDALEEQRRVLQGYGADSREAADALRDLQNAQLDASDAALDVADAKDRVSQAEANLAKARASGNQNDITRAERELQRANNALARANQRLEDARKATGAAQQNYQGTVSGFDPNSPQAQAAAANVASAQQGVQAANTAAAGSYRALQQAIQNVAVVQLQQSIAAMQQQIQMQQQVASTTLSIQGQAVAVQQAQLALQQLGADPGRPYREIDAAARGAESAQLAVKQAAYGSRDAQAELNVKLEEQKGWLSGFSADSPTYKAAYDKLRDAAKEYGDKQKAANDALKGLNDARTATADARAALETSLKNLKTTAGDVALQTEKIKLQMQQAAAPADIFRQRLDAVKDASFRLKDQQQKVHDLTRDIRGLMGQTAVVDSYRTSFGNLNGTLAYTAGYLAFIQQTLRGLSGGSAPTAARPAGARAAGGPVNAGETYLVGERGPELFVPRSSGTILPNGSTGGGQVNVTFASGAIVVQAAPGQDTAAIAEAAADRVAGKLRMALAGR